MASLTKGLNEKEFDNWLRKTGNQIWERELATIPSVEELLERAASSAEQTSRMQSASYAATRLVRRDNIFRNISKTAAIIIITLTVGFSTLVVVSPDVRASVRQILIEWFDRFTRFTIASEGNNDVIPVTPGDFAPTFLPEGFIQIDNIITENFAWLIFENNMGKIIDLIIQLFEYGVVSIDNEYRDFLVKTISGIEYHIFEATAEGITNSIYWFYEGLSFDLSSADLSITELELIALSVSRN